MCAGVFFSESVCICAPVCMCKGELPACLPGSASTDWEAV